MENDNDDGNNNNDDDDNNNNNNNITIMIMIIVFLERLSMRNMLSCVGQAQIPKHNTHRPKYRLEETDTAENRRDVMQK